MNLKKIKTGIKGFDELIHGGFLPGKIILLSGTPGTGKTIFGLQFLYNGATQFNEKGMFVSFEENLNNVKSQARKFNWDFDKLEKEGKVIFFCMKATDITKNTINEIIDIVKRNKIKRLVIDSLSTLTFITPTTYVDITEVNDFIIKRFIYSFIAELRNLDGIVTLLISQTTDGQLSRDGVSEFLCDGIIHLIYESIGGPFSRSLHVRKMREVNHDEDIHPLEINKTGLIVHKIK